MLALLQRVREARVEVATRVGAQARIEVVGAIGLGLPSRPPPGPPPTSTKGQGRALYEAVLRCARGRHAGPVQAGRFGADMQVHLVNDGPVTIPLTVR